MLFGGEGWTGYVKNTNKQTRISSCNTPGFACTVSWQHVENKLYLWSKPCSCTLCWANASCFSEPEAWAEPPSTICKQLCRPNPRIPKSNDQVERTGTNKVWFPWTGASVWIFPVYPVRVGLTQHHTAVVLSKRNFCALTPLISISQQIQHLYKVPDQL